MSSYILKNLKTVYNIINQIDEKKIKSNFDYSYILIDNDLGSIVVYIKEKVITIQIKDKGLMSITFNSLCHYSSFCQDEVDKFNEILIISQEILEKQHQHHINDFRQGLLDFKDLLLSNKK